MNKATPHREECPLSVVRATGPDAVVHTAKGMEVRREKVAFVHDRRSGKVVPLAEWIAARKAVRK